MQLPATADARHLRALRYFCHNHAIYTLHVLYQDFQRAEQQKRKTKKLYTDNILLYKNQQSFSLTKVHDIKCC